jgi:histidinol-phosphate aminotransferase
MKIIINPPVDQWKEILERPADRGEATEVKVSAMLLDLHQSGWDAVCRMSENLDGYVPEPALVPEEEVRKAGDRLPEDLKQAIRLAANNIRKFHQSQIREPEPVVVSPGITCYRRWVPVERVGLYIPGGTAPLFSTVLMLAIPARIAGCREIVLCSPGDREGKIHPAILFAASWCGVDRIYRLGGVQAIGAMAYGLGPVPAVDKIFGPGNTWVTRAKQLVTRDGVAIDMPAGPSELMIVADDSADPAFLAADLLSQAEHGPDSQVLLVTSSWELAEQVHQHTERQLARLPRKDIAAKSLAKSRIIVLNDENAIIGMVNRYAPEHLILATLDYPEIASRITNAGSVFLGAYSPESAGDYASGTNHTLPTSGYARAYSGLSIEAFMKVISFQELTPEGLASIQPAISSMARAEGLEAHARAAEVRIEEMRKQQADGKAGHHLIEYLNPLNLLYPLNILDPENKINPLNLIDQLLPEKRDDNLPNPGLMSLIRPNITALVPYSSARDEFAGREGIFLDANEHPVDNGLNRYPDPRQTALRNRVASIKGVDPGWLFLGNGSDEAIDLLIRIFCEPGRERILTLSPTYGMYAVCAAIQDVPVDRVLLNPDFTLDVTRVLESIRFDTKMIFLCSPNNPTGNQIPVEDIRFLAVRFNGIVVVDEAYIDFAGGVSALTLLDECPNVVVLQTFSKAWGLAGVRLGMAFGRPELVRVMNKVKYPYNVNVLTASAVENVLVRLSEGLKQGKQNERQIGPDVRMILTERIRLADRLKRIPAVQKVYPSNANFLLVRFDDPKGTYRYLSDNGLIVRDRSTQPLCEGCLRITVGTPEQNDKLIDLLESSGNGKPTTDNRI